MDVNVGNVGVCNESELDYLKDFSYEADSRVQDSSVQALVKQHIVKYTGFDDLDDSQLSQPVVGGHLFVGFTGFHACIVVVPSDLASLANTEAFTHLDRNQFQHIEVQQIFDVHLALVNAIRQNDGHDNDYHVTWHDRSDARLGFYQRLFYVCDLEEVSKKMLKEVALAIKPEFYSTFYSDCLQFCKDYVKLFLVHAEIPVIGTVMNRVDALALTGTRIEAVSRQTTSGAVVGNRSFHSLPLGEILGLAQQYPWWVFGIAVVAAVTTIMVIVVLALAIILMFGAVFRGSYIDMNERACGA